MLVKSNSTSKLAIIKFVLKCFKFFKNENKSLIVYWLYDRGSNNGTKFFGSLQVGVPIADNIGQKGATPSTKLLWILQRPYKIPGLEPVGYNSLYTLSQISFLFL